MLNTIGDIFFKENPNKILGIMSEGFRGRIIVESSNEFIKNYFDSLFSEGPIPVYNIKQGINLQPVLNVNNRVKAPDFKLERPKSSFVQHALGVTKQIVENDSLDSETSDLILILQSLETNEEVEDLIFILKNLK